jgi:hypothetical protein
MIAAAALVLGTASAAQAQYTLTPVFSAPYRAFQQHEIGVAMSSAGDYSLEGYYGYGVKSFDIEFRGGYISAPGGTRVALGAQVRERVITNSEQFPLDGALTLGLGGNFGNGPAALFVPVGLSLGRRFVVEGSKTSFVPYVHPFVGVLHVNSNGATPSSTDLRGGLGLGVDIRFTNTFDVRISGGVGDVNGIALGVAFVR